MNHSEVDLMLAIGRKQVEVVLGWDAMKFETWLEVELAVFLGEGAKAEPFRPLHNLFLPSEPVWSTLKQIHDALEPRTQAAMRAGIANVIHNLRPGDGRYEMLATLLAVVSALKLVEATDGIVAQVGYGAFGSPANPNAPDAFALSLITLAGLSFSPRVVEGLKSLCDSSWFKDEYAATALVALSQADHDIIAHLERLNSRFETIRKTKSSRLDRMFKEIAVIVPMPALARLWSRPPSKQHRWFMDGLTCENGPFQLKECRNEFCLMRRSDRVMELIKIDEEQEFDASDYIVRQIDAESRRRVQGEWPDDPVPISDIAIPTHAHEGMRISARTGAAGAY